MGFYFRFRTPARLYHDEPKFDDDRYVAQYSQDTGEFADTECGPLVSFVADNLPDHRCARILDIGTGPGWLAIRLAERMPELAEVVGLDVSDSFINVANENSRRWGVENRVRFRAADATSMDMFQDDSFDAVVSHQSVHYWAPPESVFNEIARVLKPAGVFCIGADRRDLSWRARLSVASGMRIISRAVGISWKQAFAGCYTPDEVGAILQRSELRDRWELVLEPRRFRIQHRRQNDALEPKS